MDKQDIKGSIAIIVGAVMVMGAIGGLEQGTMGALEFCGWVITGISMVWYFTGNIPE